MQQGAYGSGVDRYRTRVSGRVRLLATERFHVSDKSHSIDTPQEPQTKETTTEGGIPTQHASRGSQSVTFFSCDGDVVSERSLGKYLRLN